MKEDILQEIKNLENEILQIDDNIVEFLRLNYDEGIKKSLHQLESDLKYLSILANGVLLKRMKIGKLWIF